MDGRAGALARAVPDRAAARRAPVRLWPLAAYFLKLGTLGFGGPIALAGFMRRDLVEARGWASEEEYRLALAVSQLMPGPLAAQLAMALGYLLRGLAGA